MFIETIFIGTLFREIFYPNLYQAKTGLQKIGFWCISLERNCYLFYIFEGFWIRIWIRPFQTRIRNSACDGWRWTGSRPPRAASSRGIPPRPPARRPTQGSRFRQSKLASKWFLSFPCRNTTNPWPHGLLYITLTGLYISLEVAYNIFKVLL